MTGQSFANVGYKISKRPISASERANLNRLDDMFRKILRAFSVIAIFLGIVNLLVPQCLTIILTGIFSLIPFVILVVYFNLRKKAKRALEEGVIVEISGVVMSTGAGKAAVFLIGPISFPRRHDLASRIVEGRPATMGFAPHLNLMVTLDNLPITFLVSVKVPKGFMESIASQPVVTQSEVQPAAATQPQAQPQEASSPQPSIQKQPEEPSQPTAPDQAPEPPKPKPVPAVKDPSDDKRVSIGGTYGNICPSCRATCSADDLFCKKCYTHLK